MEQILARHTRIAFQYSGGKDSTALLYSMKPFWGRFTVYSLDTGDMHPELLSAMERVAEEVPNFVQIHSDVFALKREFGIPADIMPWTSTMTAHQCNTGFTPLMQDRVACCFRTKMLPLHKRMIEDNITLVIRGQKKADALKGALSSGDVADGIEYLYPLENMTDQDCFDIMRHHKLPIPSFYSEGLVHSGDCIGCTAWTAEEARGPYLQKHYPDRYPAYRRDIIAIAMAIQPMVAGIFNAADACMEGE